jgi:hypothetical protein
MATSVSWKIFARLTRRVNRPDDLGTVAFHAQSSPGIYSQFSLPLTQAYVPLGLIPSATYFQVITSFFELRDNLGFAGKFPYQTNLGGLGACQLRMTVRLYSPNILAITVRVTGDNDLSLPDDLGELLSLRTIPPGVQDLVRRTVGIIDSGSHRKPNMDITLVSTVGFHLHPVRKGSEIAGYTAANRSALTGLLLGVSQVDSMDGTLVDRILLQNHEMNVKNVDELLLVNKQGVVLLSASESRSRTTLGRFTRTLDLTEIARSFQFFLDDYPLNRHGQEDFADYIYSRIRAWLRHPDAILAKSYTNRLLWESLVTAFRLQEKLEMNESENYELAQALPGKQAFFAQISDRWWESPDFAAGFDASAFDSKKILSRMRDRDLRLSVLEDLREAETSLSGKNYKAAVVMAGASVEAMLLALLEQETSESPETLRKQGLHDYIDLVRRYTLISDRAMLDLLDNSLREWRNYVHPGKALRTGVNLTPHHAQIVVTAARALAASI